MSKVSLYRRPDTGQWRLDWRENGRRRRVPCETHELALETRKEIRRRLVAIAAGLVELPAKRAGTFLPFDQWAKNFLAGPDKRLAHRSVLVQPGGVEHLLPQQRSRRCRCSVTH